MCGKKGINNIKEILELLFLISVPIINEIRKDGFQPSDLMAFLEDPDFREHLISMVTEIGEIPHEINKVGPIETFKLGKFLLNVIDRM